MPVEFIGYIGSHDQSETRPPKGAPLDISHVETVARAHEAGGFDRALVAFHSTSPESILIAGHAASVTEKLGFMIAHRPGFTAPTVAAPSAGDAGPFHRRPHRGPYHHRRIGCGAGQGWRSSDQG